MAVVAFHPILTFPLSSSKQITLNQLRPPELLDNLEVRMSNFMTLLVENDAAQREAFADLLKDEGFDVIECATAEAAELIIASTGAETAGTHHRPQPAGRDVRGRTCSVCPPPAPGYEHHRYVRRDREAYTGQHHVLAKALHCRAVARSSPRLKSVGASLQRSRAYPTPSVTPLIIPCG